MLQPEEFEHVLQFGGSGRQQAYVERHFQLVVQVDVRLVLGGLQLLDFVVFYEVEGRLRVVMRREKVVLRVPKVLQ